MTVDIHIEYDESFGYPLVIQGMFEGDVIIEYALDETRDKFRVTSWRQIEFTGDPDPERIGKMLDTQKQVVQIAFDKNKHLELDREDFYYG